LATNAVIRSTNADELRYHGLERTEVMATQVDAVFENGVFRPLEPVDLPEHLRVRVTIDEHAISSDEQVHFRLSRDQWQAFCDALDAPPKSIASLRKLLNEPSVLDEQRPAAH
jgi:predicted DNA-binding antitoxin AbrB/MazE fold protein